MMLTFSWLQEIVVTTKLWVVPTITRFFEAVYPQKSPQCFSTRFQRFLHVQPGIDYSFLHRLMTSEKVISFHGYFHSS
jgi:hypothetical protein